MKHLNAKSNNVIINVIDIQKGTLITSLNPMRQNNGKSGLSSKKLEKLMNSISFIYYDEMK